MWFVNFENFKRMLTKKCKRLLYADTFFFRFKVVILMARLKAFMTTLSLNIL